MDPIAASTLTSAIVTAVLQIVKDNMNMNPTTLKWVAAIIGGLSAGSAGFVAGADQTGSLVTSIGTGAVMTTGFHSLMLQDSVLGRILKAVGTALFAKDSVPKP